MQPHEGEAVLLPGMPGIMRARELWYDWYMSDGEMMSSRVYNIGAGRSMCGAPARHK